MNYIIIVALMFTKVNKKDETGKQKRGGIVCRSNGRRSWLVNCT